MKVNSFKVQALEEFGSKHKTRRITIAENVGSRQQARQICRNRRYEYLVFYIIHPSGEREEVKPK
jgi:hypothetical protein